MTKSLFILLLISFLSACTTPPEKIRAKYVPPTNYQDYPCEQINQELFLVDHKIFQLTLHQRMEVENEEGGMKSCFGPVLWPALYSFFGEDKKEQLAQLKGEYNALESMAKQKKCKLVMPPAE